MRGAVVARNRSAKRAGLPDRLGPAVRVQAPHDLLDVRSDGVDGDHEPVCDLVGRGVRGEKVEHLPLTGSEHALDRSEPGASRRRGLQVVEQTARERPADDGLASGAGVQRGRKALQRDVLGDVADRPRPQRGERELLVDPRGEDDDLDPVAAAMHAPNRLQAVAVERPDLEQEDIGAMVQYRVNRLRPPHRLVQHGDPRVLERPAEKPADQRVRVGQHDAKRLGRHGAQHVTFPLPVGYVARHRPHDGRRARNLPPATNAARPGMETSSRGARGR